ncbi:MAG: C25 family cysteine peptidase, partial [Deltaproteobacteria bacterium]|nr:C25 family cysteine peptidase [Deltaproteobacteria bacterium]
DAARPPDAAALASWTSGAWLAVGGAWPGFAPPGGAKLRRIDDAAKIVSASAQRLGAAAIQTIVVANPADRRGRFAPSSLSLFAPLVASVHRAPLVLVSGAAAPLVETEVQRAIAINGLAPTHLYLVGDELALRSHRVPDPVFSAGGPEALGGARDVRVELFSQIQERRPQAYAVGRLVAEDATQGSALLARQLHVPAREGAPIRVLSNADEVFALGETISRTTVSDLRNAGLPVQSAFRDAVTPAAIQTALGDAGVLVWEGHARDLTLEEGGGIAVERTPPLVVLQGCYTLDRSDPFILIERGTRDIVATSAAIYSASGSAFARAFFDALVYDHADLGTAVRNARNYLLAVAELKQRRGHADWTKTYRAALAFALWGDPTARPPLPTGTPKLPPATWRVDAHGLELTIPSKRLKTATVDRYTARPVPRAMLSGLILRAGEAPGREVKELFYTAIPAPPGVTAACPPAADWDVLSQYAPATRTLFLLARPPGDKPGSGAPAGTVTFPLVADVSSCPRPPTPPQDGNHDDDEGPA